MAHSFNRLKWIILFSLCRLALPSVDWPLAQVQCSSSYIDDFFLPTAKIALNKIQQSFSKPIGATSPTAFISDDAKLDGTTTSKTDEIAPTPSINQINSNAAQLAEPNKNEFVKIEVGSEEGSRVVDVSRDGTRQQQSRGNEPVATGEISSTEATSEDPTEMSPSESTPTASTELNPPQAEADNGLARTVSSAGDQSASTQSESADPVGIGEPKPNVKPSEEAIRETELEAIAAVDASIGFGDSSSSSSWFAATSDACYDEYGNARFCEPEFENVAMDRQLEVSSECGYPPSRFCTISLSGRNSDQIRNCHICDSQHPKKRHPAAYLTDVNDYRAPTCWVSAPIGTSSRSPVSPGNSSGGVPSDDVAAAVSQPGASDELQRDNVTITINLDKRYEITYISMQFCSLRPDSLAIWKSMDFGKSWLPYQYYSSLCAQLYGHPTQTSSDQSAGHGGRLNAESGQIEAVCVNSSSLGSSASSSANAGRVTFSTSVQLDSTQASNGDENLNSSLLDWATATNIRVVLDRHQASWIQSNLGHAHHHLAQRSASATINSAGNNLSSSNSQAQPPQLSSSTAHQPKPIESKAQDIENSLTSPSDTYNYAISDLTIGGRCKCNGHASRCVHNPNGRLQCDCQHNTDGVDCEKCLPLHHDRPWQRATQANANPCQPCNCNGHSRKCRFDPELYLLSGKRSGGVCIDCKDNTTGRHCNYCKEGFTRDHTRPMSDQNACKLCDCHPVGSLGKVCNHLTGQCPCKEGVTGLECNRCAPGYQQSSSPTEPCIKLPENDINYEPSIETPAGAEDEQGAQVAVDSIAHQPASTDQEPSLDFGPLESESSSIKPTPTPSPARPTQPAVDDNRIDPMEGEEARERLPPPPPPSPPAHSAPRSHSRQHWPKSPYPFGYRHSSGARPALGEEDQISDIPAARARFESKTARTGSRHGFGQGPLDGFYNEGKWYQFDYRQQQQLSPVRNIESLHPSGGFEPDEYGREYAAGALYPAPDETNFNNIPHQAMLPPSQQHQQQPAYPKSRYPLARQQHSYQANGLDRPSIVTLQRHRFSGTSSSCANCQARIKKLNSKQFCHLDFAIRARVLGRRVSSDWTKYEVEIQDIFKSPSSSALLLQQQQQQQQQQLGEQSGEPIQKSSRSSPSSMAAAYQIDAAQSDDPNALAPGDFPAPTANQSQPLASNEQQTTNAIPAPSEHPIHRLRIGGVQWIWVPTEDVNCKCPRLRLHSSYLLMGLVDAHEHSTGAIQLDRHGVSMVWRPSLQEKLIKYQRLHSDGLCWRTN